MYVRKNVMSFLFLVTTQSIAEDNNILLIYFPCVSPSNTRHVASIGGGGSIHVYINWSYRCTPPPRIRIFQGFFGWVWSPPLPHTHTFFNDVTYLYTITSMLSCLLYVTVQTWKLSNISDIVRVVLALKTAQHST